jgi:hypothetical protein
MAYTPYLLPVTENLFTKLFYTKNNAKFVAQDPDPHLKNSGSGSRSDQKMRICADPNTLHCTFRISAELDSKSEKTIKISLLQISVANSDPKSDAC